METSDTFTLTILPLLVTSVTILLALFVFRRGSVRPSAQEIEPAPPLSARTRLLMSLSFFIIISSLYLYVFLGRFDLLASGGSGGGAPDLVYQILIQDEKTGQPIKGANVFIEVNERAFVKKITDLNGRSVLVVDPSLSGEHARLIIESEAYNISSQEVTLIEKGVPSLILLEPNN